MADTVLYRCGHLCVCYTCGLQLQQSTSVHGIKCPICRAPVDDILRVYRSSRDGE
jgi:protein neuralized